MTRDASLDEFLGGGAEDEDGGRDDGGDDAAAAAESPDEAAAADAVAAEPDEDARADTADDTDAEREAAPADTAGGDDAEFHAPAEVEPARSTYAWSPEGAACAACEATVERRWRDEPGLVCADCKEW